MESITQFSKYRGIQGIYSIININKPSKKCPYGTPYVGQTISKPLAKKHKLGIGHRLCEHRCELRKNIHHNPKLQRAWNKYGERSFIFIMIEKVDDKSSLTKKEQFWMDEWDAYHNGYNARPIAETSLGHKTKPEIKKSTAIDWIKKYYKDNGVYPKNNSGIIEYADEKLTWGGLDRALSDGFRGFDGGSSLSKFVSESFGIVTLATSKKYNDVIIKKWIEMFYDENGYYPTKRSGVVKWAVENGFSSINWSSVNECMLNCQKGFIERISLRNFIEKNATRELKFKFWYNKEN